MLITIGILAYNEAKNIERTLQSLLEQSVFRSEGALAADEWEILIVPNGCKDATASVAHDYLAKHVPALNRPTVRFRVESLTQPGKSNAWNQLVHRIARPDTDVFVMMDADIEFGHVDTIRNCVLRMLAEARIEVVVDLPLKDFTRKRNLTVLERISARASQMNLDARPGISGQFYCIRGPFVRQVWMPVGLSVEDGFLNAMVATNCFRTDPDHSKVVRADDASHYYEGLVDVSKVVKHEVRIVIGTVLNCFLCWDTLLFLTPKNGAGAGELVRDMNSQNPDWYRGMMLNQVRTRGRWVVPFSFMWRRFGGSRRQPLGQFLLRLPVRLAATVFDVVVYFKANSSLKSERAVGYW